MTRQHRLRTRPSGIVLRETPQSHLVCAALACLPRDNPYMYRNPVATLFKRRRRSRPRA
ncbi:hypothetical protein LZ31DRAFT_553569 [Colletotrichum somersetense]|nr:hypothetical protein LZ31DRAFT_553569 [Colletotrichum somersetense]